MKLIVLDPGHGATDKGGANKNNLIEKDLNLTLALKIGDILKNYCDVLYTRTTDVNPSLRERGATAVKNKADLMLSVHFNAYNTKARGPEAVISIHATPEIKALSENMTRTVANVTGNPYRRVFNKPKSATEPNIDWYGIPRYSLPVQSIIIESLFMDNLEDIKYLQKPGAMDGLALAISSSIIKHYNLQEKQMDYATALAVLNKKVGISVEYWKGKAGIDPYFDDLIIKIATVWSGQ